MIWFCLFIWVVADFGLIVENVIEIAFLFMKIFFEQNVIELYIFKGTVANSSEKWNSYLMK